MTLKEIVDIVTNLQQEENQWAREHEETPEDYSDFNFYIKDDGMCIRAESFAVDYENKALLIMTEDER